METFNIFFDRMEIDTSGDNVEFNYYVGEKLVLKTKANGQFYPGATIVLKQIEGFVKVETENIIYG